MTFDNLNLTKQQSFDQLNLRKEMLNKGLEGTILENHTARVAVVLDYSGSMSSLYKNGTVQAIVERIFPIALKFDNDGAMDVWTFDNGFKRRPQMTLENYYGYVSREITGSMGGTNYSPVIKDISKFYLEENPEALPEYVIFITDGDNFDKSETTKAIQEVSNYPIFWQFVGIGGTDFPYLEKLDDMSGRYVDNADFFCVSNAKDFATHDGVYQLLLNEYPQWLTNPKVADLIANKHSKQSGSTGSTDSSTGGRRKLFGLF